VAFQVFLVTEGVRGQRDVDDDRRAVVELCADVRAGAALVRQLAQRDAVGAFLVVLVALVLSDVLLALGALQQRELARLVLLDLRAAVAEDLLDRFLEHRVGGRRVVAVDLGATRKVGDGCAFGEDRLATGATGLAVAEHAMGLVHAQPKGRAGDGRGHGLFRAWDVAEERGGAGHLGLVEQAGDFRDLAEVGVDLLVELFGEGFLRGD